MSVQLVDKSVVDYLFDFDRLARQWAFDAPDLAAMAVWSPVGHRARRRTMKQWLLDLPDWAWFVPNKVDYWYRRAIDWYNQGKPNYQYKTVAGATHTRPGKDLEIKSIDLSI